MKIKIDNIKKFVKKNPLIVLLFILSTLFFLIQHYFSLSWDFMAYVMNARYLFGNGEIFEVYRAPMTSLILGLFIFLGKAAEYIYILIVSGLFFYSSIKLSDVLFNKCFYKFNSDKEFVRFVFYFFSLNLFVLVFGVLIGTELLGLVFFELFLVYFLLNKNSGHFLGLAFLTRYNFLFFIPLLFINKDYKKILKNIGLFVLVSFPWYLFNLIKFGNGFSSIVDSYNLNILSRQNLIQQFDFSAIFIIMNCFLIFFIIGIGIFLYFLFKKKEIDCIKYFILYLFIFIVVLIDFLNTPFKITRYLFNLVLPIAFFSSVGALALFKIKGISKEKLKKTLTYLFLIIFLLSLIFLVFAPIEYSLLGSGKQNLVFKNAAQDISETDLKNCEFFSPHWVLVNYHYPSSKFLPYDIDNAFKNNHPVVVFYNFYTIDDNYDRENLSNYNIVKKTEQYMILAPKGMTNKTCVQWKGYANPSIENPCNIISKRFEKLKLEDSVYNFCNFINLK